MTLSCEWTLEAWKKIFRERKKVSNENKTSSEIGYSGAEDTTKLGSEHYDFQTRINSIG